MNRFNTRLWHAIDRARSLVVEAERLIELSRRRIHDVRNSRNHAVLSRMLFKVSRRARSG
jgi:hypothetical protein